MRIESSAGIKCNFHAFYWATVQLDWSFEANVSKRGNLDFDSTFKLIISGDQSEANEMTAGVSSVFSFHLLVSDQRAQHER